MPGLLWPDGDFTCCPLGDIGEHQKDLTAVAVLGQAKILHAEPWSGRDAI
jgi:hypothetical protein